MNVPLVTVALGPVTKISVMALSQPYPTMAEYGLPGPALAYWVSQSFHGLCAWSYP